MNNNAGVLVVHKFVGLDPAFSSKPATTFNITYSHEVENFALTGWLGKGTRDLSTFIYFLITLR
jgi:hypothetical protein